MDCEVVRDLLPSYVEKLSSEKTNDLLKEHFETCEACKKELEEMLYEIHIDKVPQNQDFKKYLNKTKQMYILKGILLSVGVIGIFVSFFVDFAMNQKLTWSLIVDMGVVYVYAILFTLFLKKKNKLFCIATVASVLLLPMLWGIEYVINSYFLTTPQYWLKEIAVPICIIWIAILYISIFIQYLTKNLWFMLGGFLILCSVGSVLTNAIAQELPILETFNNGYDWIDDIVSLLCGILCIIVGCFRKGNWKTKFRLWH